jgi:hypothetical protein
VQVHAEQHAFDGGPAGDADHASAVELGDLARDRSGGAGHDLAGFEGRAVGGALHPGTVGGVEGQIQGAAQHFTGAGPWRSW